MLREKNEEEEKEKRKQREGEDEEEKERGPGAGGPVPAKSTLETRGDWMLRVESQARLQAECLLRSSAFLLRPSAAWIRPARTKESILLYSELLMQMVTSSQNISRHHPKRV